jgi:hypothetical protein
MVAGQAIIGGGEARSLQAKIAEEPAKRNRRLSSSSGR